MPSAIGSLNSQLSAFQTGAINNAQGAFGNEDATLNYATGPGGDPTKSPLYSSFLTKARQATSNSYDQAVMDTRGNAASRGFGYASPNEAGAETGVRASEAGALSGAPATALQETMPYSMEAAGLYGQQGASENQLGASFSSPRSSLIEQQAKDTSSMYSSLATLAGGILGGPIGGDLAGMIFPSQDSSGDNSGGLAG